MHLSEHKNKGTFAKPRFHEAGAPEITLEMIRAGVKAYLAWSPEQEEIEELVTAIYFRMREAAISLQSRV